MSKNSQIYMFLLRGSDFFKTSSAAGAANILNPIYLAKNIVRGDCLDVPFVGFMNVESLTHKINIGDSQAGYKDVKQANPAWGSRTASEGYSPHEMIHGFDKRYLFGGSKNQTDYRNPYTGSKQPLPGTVFGHLPDHGTLEFSKYLDSATPQLAFGCSAQEKYPLAAFYYRRRTGMGMEGVRAPYLVIGLRRVMIADWELSDDLETVKLRYERICWIGTSSFADTNAPVGASIRYWDRDRNRGGEAGLNWASGLAALTAALVAGSGAIVKAAQ